MILSKIYSVKFNYQDGNGWQDITKYVRAETLVIRNQAFNESYRSVQSSCDFELIYNQTLFDKIIAQTKDVLVQVSIVQRNNDLYMSLAGTLLAGEYLGVSPRVMFTGKFRPNPSRVYTGVLDEMFLKIQAKDSLLQFENKIGDILYVNNKIYDPFNVNNSIVHKLSTIAGLSVDNTKPVINITIPNFAPADPEGTVMQTIDDLMFEHGYTITMDTLNKVSYINWMDKPETNVIEFTDGNILDSIDIQSINHNDDCTGIKLTYFGTGSRADTKIYRDSSMPYSNTSGFLGIAVPPNGFYPYQFNSVIPPDHVYQEYTDESISYFTNKTQTDKALLGYNWKAFQSDFTDIIATTNHRLDCKKDADIIITKQEFGNKRAELKFKNTNVTTSKYIYYLDLYATVVYRKSKAEIDDDAITDFTNVREVVTAYLQDTLLAEKLYDRLLADIDSNLYKVTFTSYDKAYVGDTVRVVTGDGLDIRGIVMSVGYTDVDNAYKYEVWEWQSA